MSVIAEVSVPAEQFPLGDLLEVRPGVEVRLEPVVPVGQADLPFLWARSPDVEAVTEALDGSSMVESVEPIDQVGDETLFRVDWAGELDGIVETIRETDAALLAGGGHGDDWTFSLRFQDHDALRTFYRTVVSDGVDVELEGIHDPNLTVRGTKHELTAEQREALLTAFEAGYFSVPRQTTLVELAEALGISDSAVSQRIRRGLHAVLETELLP